jgi:hypothetical protein
MEIELDTKVLAIFVIALLSIGIAYGIINYLRIPNTGKIKAIQLEIYKDADCTTPLIQINWGNVSPSESYQYEAYIINKGNIPLTLTMKTENWNPSNAKDYITLTWDRENATLQPNSPLKATFTLTIASTIPTNITNFYFEIVIYGNEGA